MRMKRLVFALAACLISAAATAQEWRVFESKDYGFAISYPPNWEAREGALGTCVIIISPMEGMQDNFRENANVTLETLAKPMSAQEYMDACVSLMEKNFPGFVELSRGAEGWAGKVVPYLICRHSFPRAGAKAMLYFYVSGSRAYVLTCTATESTFDRFQPYFKQIAASFRITGSPRAFGRTEETAAGGLFSNDKFGYSILFPQGWEIREQGPTIVMALSPREGAADPFRENINVCAENLNRTVTIEEYMSASLVSMRRMLKGFQELSRGTQIIGDRKSAWLIYTHSTFGKPVKGIVYLFVKGNRGYAVTCTATEETFDNYIETFRKTVATFSLK